MIKSVIYINDDNKLTFRAYNEDQSDYKECYDKMAIDIFNKLIKWDNDQQLTIEDNGKDKTFTSKEFDVTFEDYERVSERIVDLKRKDIKRKIGVVAIGLAGVATVGTLATTIIDINTKKNTTKSVLDGEPITIEETKEPDEVVLPVIEESEGEKKTPVEETDLEDNTIYVGVAGKYDEKLLAAVNKYWDIIVEVGEKWGVDPYLIRDIMMQESFGGRLENKGQLVFKEWKDQVLRLYNFKENRMMKIVLTDTPEKFKDVDQRISRDEAMNEYTSISLIGAIVSYTFNTYTEQNLPLSIEMYNQGYGAMDDILHEQAKVEGLDFDTLRKDGSNVGFLNYTYVRDTVNEKGEIVHHADPEYLLHVLGQGSLDFNIDYGKSYRMKYRSKSGEIKEFTVRFQSEYTKENSAVY